MLSFFFFKVKEHRPNEIYTGLILCKILYLSLSCYAIVQCLLY